MVMTNNWAASQGAFEGSDIALDERDIAGHAANQRSEPGKAGVSGSMPERSTITRQQHATEALWQWQELRDRTPAERIRILVERELLPPDNDNEDRLEAVREAMNDG